MSISAKDARLVSTGLAAVGTDDAHWSALLQFEKLNRGSAPDQYNTLTATS